MITEDYVSFEIAKLLKEKGFDSENVSEFGGFYIDFYHNGQFPGIATEAMMLNKTLSYWEYLRPTLQMAMKWLRDEHNILLVVDYEYECTDTSYYYKIYKLGKNGKPKRIAIKGVRYGKIGEEYKDIIGYRDYERSYSDYKTYEETCNAGIRYCLENLV